MEIEKIMQNIRNKLEEKDEYLSEVVTEAVDEYVAELTETKIKGIVLSEGIDEKQLFNRKLPIWIDEGVIDFSSYERAFITVCFLIVEQKVNELIHSYSDQYEDNISIQEIKNRYHIAKIERINTPNMVYLKMKSLPTKRNFDSDFNHRDDYTGIHPRRIVELGKDSIKILGKTRNYDGSIVIQKLDKFNNFKIYIMSSEKYPSVDLRNVFESNYLNDKLVHPIQSLKFFRHLKKAVEQIDELNEALDKTK